MIIAIDGPAGAGKSTVAKETARRLGMSYLDTGAMYRAVASRAIESLKSLDDGRLLGEFTDSLSIEFIYGNAGGEPDSVLVNGDDVTRNIRTPLVDEIVPIVARHREVRRALIDRQRRMATGDRDFVVEGRDIGTVVFPDAELKVFLTASPEERANRRIQQRRRQGAENLDFARVLNDIIERDIQDSSRDESPMKPAEDSIMIVSDELEINDVVNLITKAAMKRKAEVGKGISCRFLKRCEL